MLHRVSRSETSGAIPSSRGSSVQTVSEYMTDVLVCEDSEFCFEEVRARKYFRSLQEKQEKEQREMSESAVQEPAAEKIILPFSTHKHLFCVFLL